MSKHTPGPWLCCDGPEHYQHRIYADETETTGIAICDVVSTKDARLIAAAPDLLAAAYETVSALREAFRITPDSDDDFIYDEMGSSAAAAYFSARAAIAKAEGRP